MVGKDVAYSFNIGKEVALFLRLFLLEAGLDQPRTDNGLQVKVK